jgi:hypothetical protein
MHPPFGGEFSSVVSWSCFDNLPLSPAGDIHFQLRGLVRLLDERMQNDDLPSHFGSVKA